MTGFPMVAVDRGMESSGLALVGNPAEVPTIYKKALWGGDFIMHVPVRKYLDDIEKYSVAIGHVRAATSGRGNINDYNAHPFQYDHITLVHNGHIRNAHTLKDADAAKSPVDSAMVAFSMAKNGELETLQSVDGGFVFVWWNSKTQKLNIARNGERPLFLAYTKNENSMYWSSEVTALEHLLRQTDIDEDMGYSYPGEHTWYQYSLKDLRDPIRVPFVLSQGRLQKSSHNNTQNVSGLPGDGQYRGGPAWTDEELDAWEAYAKQGRQGSAIVHTGSANSNEIDEIRENVRNQRHKDAKQSGTPTSKKRVERAKRELRKLGLEYDQLKVCTPVTWHAYKNQRGIRGSIIAEIKGSKQPVEIVDVPFNWYTKLMSRNMVCVNCRNVRFTSGNKTHVVGVIVPQMFKYLGESPKEDPKSTDTVDTEGTREALGSIDRDYDGPGGTKITRARFLELTTQGCANCLRDIEPATHGAVVWVGSPPSPVCHECNTPEMLASLGFPGQKKLVH